MVGNSRPAMFPSQRIEPAELRPRTITFPSLSPRIEPPESSTHVLYDEDCFSGKKQICSKEKSCVGHSKFFAQNIRSTFVPL